MPGTSPITMNGTSVTAVTRAGTAIWASDSKPAPASRSARPPSRAPVLRALVPMTSRAARAKTASSPAAAASVSCCPVANVTSTAPDRHAGRTRKLMSPSRQLPVIACPMSRTATRAATT